MDRIFISYRRKDSIGIARLVYEKLIDHFGDGTVFMDIDVIPPGTNFREHINGSMERAKIVLALIGEGWGHVQGNGHSRLHDPTDFVRIELELALGRSIPIIPVLIGQTNMPTESELPTSIAKFADYNATMLDPGRDFHSHTKRLIQDVERHLRPGGFKADSGLRRHLSELVAHYYQECDALITVSPEHTLIAQPQTELIGFRNLMNSFRMIEQIDGRKRPLVWVLDLGRQKFEDLDSRMRFLNVQALLTRFKALKRFDDEHSYDRWKWLQSRVVVVLLDTRAAEQYGGSIKRPTFAPHHVSLTAIEPAWLDYPVFKELYGESFERLRERTFTIFFNAQSDWTTPSYWEANDLRYFGHSHLAREKYDTGLELPPPPTHYVEGFRSVCSAAAHALGFSYFGTKLPMVRGEEATQQLQYLGYYILRLEEFTQFC